MLKSFRSGVIVVVLLCLKLSAGVAVADPPNLEDVHQSTDYPLDGWRLHVSLENMSITSVPNMAATAFTREAFISATATVWVEPLYPDDPTPLGLGIRQRSISLWLEQGCQIKLQGGTVGLNNTSSTSISESATSAGATTTSPSASETPNPSYQQQLTPGEIVAKSIQNKAYPDKNEQGKYPTPPWVGPRWTNDTLTVSVQNWDLKYNACAGPVSFRFQGEATMSTDRSTDNVDAFGDIVQV